MSKLEDVMAYFCKNYPYPLELSKARLTKMVYLADWRMALEKEKQITPIAWVFNHYGPYVHDVEDTARDSGDFRVRRTENSFGSPAEVIELAHDRSWPSLSSDERKVLDNIIDVTKPMNFSRFIAFVYETYPVVESERYDALNLVALARRRNRLD